MTNGGYDDGYRSCDCFWGSEPGSLVEELARLSPNMTGWRILDAGCGEGKNALYCAARGAEVIACDVSRLAILHSARRWQSAPTVKWVCGDVRDLRFRSGEFHAVLAYGLLHCLPDRGAVTELTARFQQALRPGGFAVVCSFNARRQELEAHPGFSPTLLSHQDYVEMFADWELIRVSDRDLEETHPHNGIRHTHSMTRIIARKRSHLPGGQG